MKIKHTLQAVGAGLALIAAGSASAATINQGLTGGVLNTVEDQDREAYFDVDQSGTLSIGDVFVGFVRMDNFLPSGLPGADQVYGVISNQIVSVDANDNTILEMGNTTTVGLRLEDITGDANTAGGMFAIYDTGGSYGDLIGAPVGTGMKDNTDWISSNGTLRIVAGVTDNGQDFFQVDNNANFGIGTSNDFWDTLPASVTVGNFTGGLSVLYNNTNFTYDQSVLTVDALGGPHITQIGVGNGAIRGAAGDGNEDVFTNGSQYAVNSQCFDGEVNVACGFVTDADFFVVPQEVPEPGTLSLFGGALLGLGLARRRKQAKA